MQKTEQQREECLTANRELARRFFAEQDRMRGGPAPELCTSGYVARMGENPPMDREGHEGFARAFYGAFADMHHEVEQVIAEEGAMVVRFVIHGTHGAPFFGIPATHHRVRVAAHVILRVEQGKVKELVGIFDEAGMLRQIGALPS